MYTYNSWRRSATEPKLYKIILIGCKQDLAEHCREVTSRMRRDAERKNGVCVISAAI